MSSIKEMGVKKLNKDVEYTNIGNDILPYPKVVVILVNFNGGKFLKDCLSAVCNTDYPDFEVVVVDDYSNDGSADFIKDNFHVVFLIKNKKEKGWGAGNNIGVKYAEEVLAKYLIFLNVDTVVDKRWIIEAVKVIENDPAIGILSFAEYGRMTNTTSKEFLDAQKKFSKIEVSYTPIGPGTTPFFMIRIDVFRELGFFDGRYFTYGVDNDFELRVIRAGYKLAKINLPCFHHGMGLSKPSSVKAARLVMRSTLRLQLVHGSLASIFKTFKMLFNYACNPFLGYDEKDIQFRRFRPAGIFLNFLLMVYAVCWNIYYFPEVCATRRKTTKIVNMAREKNKKTSIADMDKASP